MTSRIKTYASGPVKQPGLASPAVFLMICTMIAFVIYDVSKAQVTVSADGKDFVLTTHADTVEEVLLEQDIEVGRHDKVDPPLAAAVNENLEIEWKEARQITLTIDEKEKTLWTTEESVEEILKENGVEVTGHDNVRPGLTKKVGNEAEINVTRLNISAETEEETISYKTKRKKDSSMEAGKEKVKQHGKDGLRKKHYEVTTKNGKETERNLVKEEVVTESRDHIVLEGTKTAEAGKKESDKSGSWKTFSATAYTANCNGCSGVTRTGVNLRENPEARVIAVDPSVIPLGTQVEIKGHGVFTAADTGGAVKGNKIDVFMPDNGRAVEFGRRSVEVRIID